MYTCVTKWLKRLSVLQVSLCSFSYRKLFERHLSTLDFWNDCDYSSMYFNASVIGNMAKTGQTVIWDSLVNMGCTATLSLLLVYIRTYLYVFDVLYTCYDVQNHIKLYIEKYNIIFELENLSLANKICVERNLICSTLNEKFINVKAMFIFSVSLVCTRVIILNSNICHNF